MKQYLNKKVKLNISYDNSKLFFTATVIEVTDTHITFIDRHKEIYTFKIAYVDEISPV